MISNQSATKNDLKDIATREDIKMIVSQAKFDLAKWIVGGIIVNGVVATLLKFFAQ